MILKNCCSDKYFIDPVRFIRESVRVEPVEAQPFDKPVLSEVEGLRANAIKLRKKFKAPSPAGGRGLGRG